MPKGDLMGKRLAALCVIFVAAGTGCTSPLSLPRRPDGSTETKIQPDAVPTSEEVGGQSDASPSPVDAESVHVDAYPDVVAESAPPPDAAVQERDAAAADAPPICMNACTKGNKRCEGEAVQTCVDGPLGCSIWGSSKDCPSPQLCKAMGTSASCICPPGSCVAGTKRCTNGSVQECVMAGACASWGGTSACPSPQKCSGAGECKCPAGSCTVGSRQCGGGGVQVCEQVGECTGFGAPSSCTSPQTCMGTGECRCPSGSCAEGARQCGRNGGVQVCARSGVCTDFGAEMPCSTGLACRPDTGTCGDTVAITSATLSVRTGALRVTATSSDGNHSAILKLRTTNTDWGEMVSFGDGTYVLSVTTNASDGGGTATVTSSLGGSASTTVMIVL